MKMEQEKEKGQDLCERISEGWNGVKNHVKDNKILSTCRHL